MVAPHAIFIKRECKFLAPDLYEKAAIIHPDNMTYMHLFDSKEEAYLFMMKHTDYSDLDNLAIVHVYLDLGGGVKSAEICNCQKEQHHPDCDFRQHNMNRDRELIEKEIEKLQTQIAEAEERIMFLQNKLNPQTEQDEFDHLEV